MKKNLINAALLGLLVVAAPACTFVSCKDYDDDFNKVNNRLDGLESARTSINTEITNLKSSLEAANKKASELEANLANYATKAELQAAVANLSKQVAEIAKLETRVAALETAKAELTALVNAKVDQTVYDAKVKEIEAKLTAAESSVKLVTDKANTLEQTLKTLDEKVANQQKTLDSYAEKIKALETADADAKKALEELKKKVEDEVAALKKDVKALQDAGYQTEAQVDAKIKPVSDKVDALEKALNQLRIAKVTSLNFVPNHYEGGIESMISSEYFFNAITKLDKADDKGVVTFGTEEGTLAATESFLNYAAAVYHVNPSNAKVDTDVKNFKFVDVRATSTRAATEKVTVKSVNFDEKNGLLVVDFHNNLPAELPATPGTPAEINVVALNYAEKDGDAVRMVVSDYARVVKEYYNTLRIGKATAAVDFAAPRFKTTATSGAFVGIPALKTLTGAAAEAQQFTVLSDGTATKLAELVRTYDSTAPEALDLNAAAESTLKDAGFHYEFALVKDGAADKSTDIFTLDPKTGEVKVAFDEAKPYQHLGKEAAVRVTLVTEKGEVATVGYYTLKVAAPAKSFATVSVDAELKYACGENSVHPSLEFDLEPVTKYLASQFGMAEGDVWKNGSTNNFTIKTPAGAHDQFTIKDNVATAAAHNKRIGKLLRSITAAGKNIVTWSDLKEKDVANLRKEGQKLSTVLQVIKRDDPNVVLYFTVEWAPKSIQKQPEVTFKGEALANGWFKNLNVDDEIEQRMHVAIDGTHAFTHNLVAPEFFKNNTVKVDALTGYTSEIISSLTSEWKFVEPRVKTAEGVNGKTYQLSVSADGTQFLAQEMKDGKVIPAAPKAPIASITPVGVVTYESNDVAKALLNHAAFNQLKDGETLTARVAYVTTICSGAEKKVLKTNGKNAEFDLKFIRPLNVQYTGKVAFGDANQATQDAEINFDNGITDWREVKDLAKLKAAYGISGNFAVGFAPTSEWTTDYNGGKLESQKVSDFGTTTFGVSVAATPAGTPVVGGDFNGYTEYAFGTYPKLHYQTNTANLKQFTIRIPVYVKYAWGEIKSHIDVTVGKTQNQPGGARRK